MSKQCIKCGAELEDMAVFCDECGTQQISTTAKEQSKKKLSTFQSNNINVQQSTKLKNSGMGLVSLILGILSLCTIGCLFVTEILGIIFGVIALRDKDSRNEFPLTGLITSIIALIFIVVIIIIGMS